MNGSNHLLEHCVLFGRYLRALGILVSPRQVTTLAESLAYIDIANSSDFRAAAQAILVTRQEHIAPFQQAFQRFWLSPRGPSPQGIDASLPASAYQARALQALPVGAPGVGDAGQDDGDRRRSLAQDRTSTYSAREILRHKDFARLTPDEISEVRRLLLAASWRPPQRRSRRVQIGSRGPQLDMRSSWRHSLRHGGELFDLRRRRRQRKPRPLVLLCDISGSMERYARILLQLAYVLGSRVVRQSKRQVEVFVFGTRLTRLTRQLRQGNASPPALDRALRAAAEEIQDWGGGTRIGEALKRFNYDWGRRVLRHGAVVLIISDGLDRGDVDLLAREMARLQRSCHRLIWLNPLLGDQGYQPLTRGMQAALPFVDEFRPIHNLASLEQVLRALSPMAGAIRTGSSLNRLSSALPPS